MNANASARSNGALATSWTKALNSFMGGLEGGPGGGWREGFEAGARSVERARSSMGGWGGGRNTDKPWATLDGEPWNPYVASAGRESRGPGGGDRPLPDFSVLPKRSILKKGRACTPRYMPSFAGPAVMMPRGGVRRLGTPNGILTGQYAAMAPPTEWVPSASRSASRRAGSCRGGRVTSARGNQSAAAAQGLKKVTFDLA